MNKIEYERTKAKLELFEQRGMNWILIDIGWKISEQYSIIGIVEELKNEYKELVRNYEEENTPLKQTEIKFENNE